MDDNNGIASPSASENEDHNYIGKVLFFVLFFHLINRLFLDFLTLAFEMESEKDILNCMDGNIINGRTYISI
jgi:hypothetical protein